MLVMPDKLCWSIFLLLFLAYGRGIEHATPQSTALHTNSSKTASTAQKGNSSSSLGASKSSSSTGSNLESIDYIISKAKEVRKAEQPLKLFCNITGPCKKCSPVPEGGAASANVEASETHKCRHFSHVQQMECEVDWATAEHPADVRAEPLPGITSRQRHTRVVHHQGCMAGGAATSVFWFEFGVVAVLCVSLPVVIWRKHVAQTSRS